MPDWATYRVETAQGVKFWVRAIGERDARYLATTPCKRNDSHPRVPAGVEFTVTKESA